MKVCVTCQVELRPLKNGVFFESMVGFDSQEIRMGDIWRCPVCGAQVGVGLAEIAIAYWFDKSDYTKQRQSLVDARERIVQYWQDLEAKQLAAKAATTEALVTKGS